MASSLPSLRILIRLATVNSSRLSNQCSRGMQKAQCCLQTSWQTMQAKLQLDPPHAQASAKQCERPPNVLPLSHPSCLITPEVCKKTNSSDYIPYLCRCAWRWTVGILVNCIKTADRSKNQCCHQLLSVIRRKQSTEERNAKVPV